MTDVFVSYAHVDNEPLPPAEKGWVATFVASIQTLLAQRLGRAEAFKLWMDYELRGNQQITPSIHEELASAKTLLLFLSPGYLASDWCQEEIKAFVERVSTKTGQVFVVELDEIEVPETLSDLKRYRFWVKDEAGKPRRLARPEPSPSEKIYYQLLDDLARDLAERIETLDEPDPEPKHEYTVFLAQTPTSLERARDDVRRYLEQQKVRVLPEQRLPLIGLEQAVDEALDKADLFVQLLDVDPGQGSPAFQFERAGQAEVPVMQWRPRKLDPTDVDDPAHRGLLEQETVAVSSLVEFQEMIRTRLYEPEPEPAPKPNGNSLLVFLDAGEKDIDLARETSKHLQARGIGFALPMKPEAGTKSTAIRRDFENNVIGCDAVLMLFSDGPREQVRELLIQCHKLRARRDKDFAILAVCVEAGEPDNPLDLFLPDMQMLKAPALDPANCAEVFLQAVES